LDGETLVPTTASTLARRSAFRLGATRIDPASREVRGPGGHATIEPRVMQVLLVLAGARGRVVPREDLIRLCWNSQVVGDDALNRAVGEVRRIARTLAANEFVIETIPRTGYRLTGAAMASATIEAGADFSVSPMSVPTSRRLVLGGAALGIAAAAGAAAWVLWPDGKARQAADLSRQAQLALSDGMPDGVAQGIAMLRQAVALQPSNAALWGRLALAWRSMLEIAPPAQTAAAVRACELAASRAMSLEPKQADARTALIMLRAAYGDWLAVEAALRGVLADSPGNDVATGELAALMQSVGRVREAGALADLVAARLPLSPVYQYRLALSLWSRGRQGDADRAIDRAFATWPRHPEVWFARVWLMGFTGRARVALAQIADLETRPVGLPEQVAAMLRTSMEAIQTPHPPTVQAAVDGTMAAARKGPSGSISAILILSGLGRLDEAFSVANGYLLRRGETLMPLRSAQAQASIADHSRRHTQVLFVPVSAPLRADPRFLKMCDGCGLLDYWRRSGHRPDYMA
jgi:DNA-binding winged helix-turn-helix (wHTH) protein/tetratricopeptide (TPR) repeat protein